MEPTLFIVSLIVIANLRITLQQNNYTALKRNSLENFNEMIDQLIAETEGTTTLTPDEAVIVREGLTNSNQNRSNSTAESRNAVPSNANRQSPNVNDVNTKSNDSRIIYIHKLIPHNATFGSVKGGGFDGENKPHVSSKQEFIGEIDRNEILKKPTLDDNTNVENEVVPRNMNWSIINTNNQNPWFVPREGFDEYERGEGLPLDMLNSRRSFNGRNPIIENQKDHGLGVIVKEEIVFEIEDEKATESSDPPIKVRFHTTTPKPVVPSKPVNEKNMSTQFFKYPSLEPQSSFVDKVNKSMYMEFLRTQKNNTINRFSRPKPQTSIRTSQIPTRSINSLKSIRPPLLPRISDTNLKFQAEFMKLNQKINTLQEFLNKTFDTENKTKTRTRNYRIYNKDPKLYNRRSKADLRTGYPGYPNMNPPIPQRSSINPFMNQASIPQIYTKPRFLPNVLPELNIARPALLHDPLAEQRLRRRLLVLQLAQIAKLSRDLHLINRLRPNPKYIVPKIVPVYRRRVVLRPLRRNCVHCKHF